MHPGSGEQWTWLRVPTRRRGRNPRFRWKLVPGSAAIVRNRGPLRAIIAALPGLSMAVCGICFVQPGKRADYSWKSPSVTDALSQSTAQLCFSTRPTFSRRLSRCRQQRPSSRGCFSVVRAAFPHPGSLKAGQDAFADAFPLELGEGGEDVKLQLPGRCRAVDSLAEADGRDPERREIIEQRHEMPQIPTEAIQPQHTSTSTGGVWRHGAEYEGGAAILRPAHALIDKFNRGPAACLDVSNYFGICGGETGGIVHVGQARRATPTCLRPARLKQFSRSENW
jgi:hypothetical protein